MQHIYFLGRSWFSPTISEINQTHLSQQSNTMFFGDTHLICMRNFFIFYCQTLTHFLQNKLGLRVRLSLAYITNLLIGKGNKWYYDQNVFILSMQLFFFPH